MWFKFNDTRSDDMGLIIPNTIFRPSWVEQVEEISIPGRAEVIKQSTGIYSNQSLNISCVATNTSKINSIYAWLHGTGKLILSTNSNEYMTARADVLVSKGVALDMAEIPITFDCFPFAYAINSTEYSITTSYTEVTNESTVFTAPIFKFKIKKMDAPILKGDVNFDGVIDARDASLVLAEYAATSAGKPSTLTDRQKIAADYNDDGVIDAKDASAILEYYANSSIAVNASTSTAPSEIIQLDVNGGILSLGIPSEVFNVGAEVTVDSGLHLIYYKDASGDMVNIMQYSSLDLPLLHEGKNYIKYSGANVESAKVIIKERWL